MNKKIVFTFFIYVLLLVFTGWNTYKAVTFQDYESLINIIVPGIAAIYIYQCFKPSGQYKEIPVYYEDEENQYEKNIDFIINNVAMPAYYIDRKGTLILGNEKLYKLLGINSDKITYNDISRMLNNVSVDELFEENQKILREKKTSIKEYSLELSDKKNIWLRVEKFPTYSKYNETSGILVFLYDVSSERELDNQKERFIATLTHDLKTPIIAQIRSLEMLINGIFGEINHNQKEILNLTMNSCKNIYSMVSTIISSYKLENNEIELNYTEINFEKIVLECCRLLQKTADEKNIKFIMKTCNEKIPVNADFHYIKTAVSFLIENSISYCFHDTQLEVFISSSNDNLNFEIHSKGPYIPDATLHMMFDKYHGQISNYNKIGFCMKLNYCNQVIKAHNGEIIAKSFINNENILGFRIPALILPVSCKIIA